MSKNKKKKKLVQSTPVATTPPVPTESPEESLFRRKDIILSLAIVGIILISFAYLGALDTKSNLFAAPGEWLTQILHVSF